MCVYGVYDVDGGDVWCVDWIVKVYGVRCVLWMVNVYGVWCRW